MSKKIVLFGQSGAGKSSVVNLMAGEEVAQTSPDMERCTLRWEEYSITFSGHKYKVFDTVGLEEPQLGTKEYLDVIVNAYSLIAKLQNEGGIDLLLFCVRASRVTAALQTNYRIFYEWLCEKKVPIVLVLTGLEREHNMEDWWERNKHIFQKYDINVAGHVCITAASKLDGRPQQLYEESRHLVRELVIKHSRHGDAYMGGETWFKSFMRMLKGLFPGNPSPHKKDVESVLTQRCRMPPEAAKELALKIRSNLGDVCSTMIDGP